MFGVLGLRAHKRCDEQINSKHIGLLMFTSRLLNFVLWFCVVGYSAKGFMESRLHNRVALWCSVKREEQVGVKPSRTLGGRG